MVRCMQRGALLHAMPLVSAVGMCHVITSQVSELWVAFSNANGCQALVQAVCEEVLPGAGANDHVTIGFAFLVGILP